MKDACISLGEGVRLVDVSDKLPRKKRKLRKDDIIRVYHHHSGADGRAGFEGCKASAEYVVNHRGWHGPAYTFWIPQHMYEEDGEICIYRCNPDEELSYHTGGKANHHGVSVCWQGNLSEKPPTYQQYHAVRMLCRYLVKIYDLDMLFPFATHAMSKPWGGTGKKSCPGKYVTEFVEELNDLT